MLGKTPFKITFETRGESERVLSIWRLISVVPMENVDFFHICEAYKAIDDMVLQP